MWAIAVAHCFILVILLLDNFPACVAVLPDNFYGTFRFQVYNCVTHTTIDDSGNGTKKKSAPTAITISNNGDNGMWKCSNSLDLVSFFSLSVAASRHTSIRSTRKQAFNGYLYGIENWLEFFLGFFLVGCCCFCCFPFLSNLLWFFFGASLFVDPFRLSVW